MIQVLLVASMAILSALPTVALANSNVNVNITTNTIPSDRITEVTILGDGTYAFPDPYMAPETTEEASALATGLAELGFPPGTPATVEDVYSIGTDSVFEEVVTSNYNPIDDPTYVLGDPDDYGTWIAIGPEDVNVEVTQTTTNYTFYRLEASLDDVCSGGPIDNCDASWAKASLLVLEKKPGKEKLKVGLKGGGALVQSDFGNPATGTTAYDLCIFDDADALVATFTVDQADHTCGTKDCWKARKDTGWQYSDKEANSHGVKKIQLFGGEAGKTRIQFQAAFSDSAAISVMPTGIAAALEGSASARVQLVSSDAQCFEATVDQVKKATTDLFKAWAK
jgi:hypothetical protein